MYLWDAKRTIVIISGQARTKWRLTKEIKPNGLSPDKWAPKFRRSRDKCIQLLFPVLIIVSAETELTIHDVFSSNMMDSHEVQLWQTEMPTFHFNYFLKQEQIMQKEKKLFSLIIARCKATKIWLWTTDWATEWANRP